MKLHYDPSTDALYLRLADTPVAESEEVRPGVVLDYDSEDRTVAIEIRDLQKRFPDADLTRMQLELANGKPSEDAA